MRMEAPQICRRRSLSRLQTPHLTNRVANPLLKYPELSQEKVLVVGLIVRDTNLILLL